MSDTIVRGGTVVTATGTERLDIAIEDGVVAGLAPELPGAGAASELDVTDLLVLPGVVDAHVHMNEPGRTAWEGFASGTRAMAVGGTTTGIDMPLNSTPPTADARAFAAKAAAARGQLHVDVALWGALLPGKIDQLDELADCGVVGFKAFMSASGVDDFEAADDLTLLEGMRAAARLGLPVAVHAENRAITDGLTARARAAGRRGIASYLASRPPIAEVLAIRTALTLAADTGCSLHVVHVSTGRALSEIAEARMAGVDVTCETCPHYLCLDEEDAERLGAIAKCAPPLRSRSDRDDLWRELLAGHLDTIGSDHSPCSPALKDASDAFDVWGGIAGAQLLLALIWDTGVVRRDLDLARLTSLLSEAPAQRVGLGHRKGRIEVGADADLVIVDPGGSWTVGREDLHDRHRSNPFLGMVLRGRVARTILRGQTIALDGQPVGDPHGELLVRA